MPLNFLNPASKFPFYHSSNSARTREDTDDRHHIGTLFYEYHAHILTNFGSIRAQRSLVRSGHSAVTSRIRYHESPLWAVSTYIHAMICMRTKARHKFRKTKRARTVSYGYIADCIVFAAYLTWDLVSSEYYQKLQLTCDNYLYGYGAMLEIKTSNSRVQFIEHVSHISLANLETSGFFGRKTSHEDMSFK